MKNNGNMDFSIFLVHGATELRLFADVRQLVAALSEDRVRYLQI